MKSVLWRWIPRTCLLVFLGVFACRHGFKISRCLLAFGSSYTKMSGKRSRDFRSRTMTVLELARGERGRLTRHASVSIPNLSSPLSRLDILRPFWLWISRDAAGLEPANLEVLVASHSASQICSIVSKPDIVRGDSAIENSRLRLHGQSAVKWERIEGTGKSILHVLLHIYAICRRSAIVLGVACAPSITIGSCRVARMTI
jgi:hypothetical protein